MMHPEGSRIRHGFLLLDGSGSMEAKEFTSGNKKHLAVAEMVQDLINLLHDAPRGHDPILLSVAAYDANNPYDSKLTGYDVESSQYYESRAKLGAPFKPEVLQRWDPLPGHGGGNADRTGPPRGTNEGRGMGARGHGVDPSGGDLPPVRRHEQPWTGWPG